MSVLLIAEHNNKEIRPFTLNAITAASQIDTDVHVLLIGKDCGNVAKSLSEMSAVKKVLHAEADYYCLLYTSPSPRDLSTSRMPSSA